MKRILSVEICLIILVCLSVCAWAAAAVPEPILEAKNSVVRILSEYSDGYATGSGFVLKNSKGETLIVTNHHVVEDHPYSISVWLNDEETVNASILAYSDQKDLCVLKLAYPLDKPALALAQKEAEQGEAVYAIGFPGAADYLSDKEAHTSADATITDGIVSAVRKATVSSYGTPTQLLQINAAINSGNSGGPLLNAKGEVVGINTYGINDSQGIFGAISVEELKDFLQSQSISVPGVKGAFPWLAVVIPIMVIILAGIVAFAFFISRRKRRSALKTPSQSFAAYMAGHPEGIGENAAVAMLLPVALQLRDLHNNGGSHLQTAPRSITIGANGAALAPATEIEADRYSSGYAAPEIYKGSLVGNLSDIYSFCALLYAATTGKQPQNSLTRAENGEELDCSELESGFAEILKKGMALDPGQRFTSMQELILKLSPYNIQSFAMDTAADNTPDAQMQPQEKHAPKRKVNRKLILAIGIPVAVVVLLGIPTGVYFGCYNRACTLAENGDFVQAQKMLFAPGITKLHDTELLNYLAADELLEKRQYEDAKEAFSELDGYLHADELAQEADYRHALQLADSSDFDQSLKLMGALKEAGYRDAEEQALEIQFRKGMYLLYEKKEYQAARNLFKKLMGEGYSQANGMEDEVQYQWAISLIESGNCYRAHQKLKEIVDYADVKEILPQVTEAVYIEGKEDYYNEKYGAAWDMFREVNGYMDSTKYINLIHARQMGSSWDDYEGAVDSLIQIFDFEDAAEVLLENNSMATTFLRGKWKTSDGKYFFEMKKNGGTSYDLPWFDDKGFEYYFIENGIYYLGGTKEDKPQYKFTLLTPDSMLVYCYKNGSTYTLYRQ